MAESTRKQPRSDRGMLLPVLVLLAVAAGAGLASRNILAGFLRPETSPDTSIPSPEPDARSKPTIDPGELRERAIKGTKLINEARQALRKLDFPRAQTLAAQGARECAPAPQARELEDLRRRAAVFGKVLSGIRPNPNPGRSLYIMRLHLGDFTAFVEGETASHYRIRLEDGTRLKILKSDVRKMQRVPDDKLARRLRKELEYRKKRASSRGPLGLYLAAVFAYRNRLYDEVLPLLDEAYEAEPDLPGLVRNYKAGNLLYQAVWQDSLGRGEEAVHCLKELLCDFPSSSHAPEARLLLAKLETPETHRKPAPTFTVAEIPPEPSAGKTTISSNGDEDNAEPAPGTASLLPVNGQVAVVEETKPRYALESAVGMAFTVDKVSVGNPKAQKIIDEADGYFEEGLRHYLSGHPSNPNHNEELEKAAELLGKASELYGRASSLAPGSRMLENRVHEATRLQHNAIRMQTVQVN